MKYAKPFVKMAGGKTKLLPELLKRVPDMFNDYYEPFIGGGALYFELMNQGRCQAAFISDLNDRLIRTYRAVHDSCSPLIKRLKKTVNTKEFFLKMRAKDVDMDNLSEEEYLLRTAVWFIYLNKTGFNGLWRVNQSGKFNVPFAGYKNPLICDEGNLRRCQTHLQNNTYIDSCSFEQAVANASKGDFVYFDSPYMPLSATSNFSSYTSQGFGLKEHTLLRDTALSLKRRKVKVLLSNSDCPAVRQLYAKGFKIEEVYAHRAINSDGAGRGKISELLIS